MKHIKKIAIAAWFCLAASSAQAIDHEVFITPRGYFPEAIYISTNFTGINDTITFRNISGRNARLRYKNGNNWVYFSPWISNNQSSTITLTNNLRNRFGSTFPVPEMSWGSVNNTMLLRDEIAPYECPDPRSICPVY